MADEQDKPSKPRRRWFQFSLQTLMLFVLVASFPLAWKGNQARKHRQAVVATRREVAEIESLRGNVRWVVYYGSPDSPRERPNWLENLFGDPGVPKIIFVDHVARGLAGFELIGRVVRVGRAGRRHRRGVVITVTVHGRGNDLGAV